MDTGRKLLEQAREALYRIENWGGGVQPGERHTMRTVAAEARAAIDHHLKGEHEALQAAAQPVAWSDMGKTPAADKQQADQHLRALLRYTENFYGAAIKHGMKAGETANAIAHIERAGKALHRLVHAWADVAAERATPPKGEPQAAAQPVSDARQVRAEVMELLGRYDQATANLSQSMQDGGNVHGALSRVTGLREMLEAAIDRLASLTPPAQAKDSK